MDGYRFRLSWPCTGVVLIVNARDYEHADRQITKWRKKGAHATFLGRVDPLPHDQPTTWLVHNGQKIRKVF